MSAGRVRALIIGAPDRADAWRTLGRSAGAGGDLPLLIVLLRRSRRLDPNSAEACYDIGVALRGLQVRAGAVRALTAALILAPANAGTAEALGLCLLESGRPDRAAPALSMALRCGAATARVLMWLARAWSGQDRRERAAPARRAAIALDPGHATSLREAAAESWQGGSMAMAARLLRRTAAVEGRPSPALASAAVVQAADWCASEGLRYERILPPRRCEIGAATHGPECAQDLPEAYLATIDDAVVLAPPFVVLARGRALILDGLTPYSRESLLRGEQILYGRADGRALVQHAQHALDLDEAVLFGGDANFSHGLLDWMSRLLVLDRRTELANLPVLASCSLPPSVLEAARLFGLSGERMIFADAAAIRCGRLHAPSLTHELRTMAPEFLEYFRVRLDLPRRPPGRGRRLYLTRGAHGHRLIVNEDEIVAALRPLGVEVFVPHGLTFARQLDVLADAALVVVPNGGGSAAVALAPMGAGVVELMHRYNVTQRYRRVAAMLDQPYRQIVGQPVRNRGRLQFDWDFRLDPDLVARFAREVLDEAGQGGG